MPTSINRAGAIAVAVRNYWWFSSLGGIYFVAGFVLWGGSRAAVVSSTIFVMVGAMGMVAHYRVPWPNRASRVAAVLGHMLLGQAILIWQQAYLPLSDFTHSGNPDARANLVYLVSALLVGTMSMFGGAWGAVLGLAMHYGFIFDVHEEFSFKWAFPVLIAVAGNIVSTASWRLDQAYNEMEKLASHDPLTGLLNRYRLVPEFERLQEVARSSGRALLLMAWDLDNLKRVNDTQGHAAGDAYIAAFAKALQASVRNATEVRAADALFRVGGDEFISLHLAAPDGAVMRARVHQEFAAVSVGWVRCETLTLDDALRTADAALYRDKSARGGRRDANFS